MPGYVFRLIPPRASFSGDLTAAEALRDGDPAVRSGHGFRTEIAPMPRLVTPDGELDGGS